MSAPDSAPKASRRWSRRRWLTIGAVVGTLAGLVLSLFVPDRYRASASVLILPQRVPERFVASTVTASLQERLNVIHRQILSRTRLERLIQEFNLYERERRQMMIMEDIIEQMRSDIGVTIDTAGDRESGPRSFSVSFESTSAKTAMQVTERLSSFFVQENLEDRSLMADQTSEFLKRRLEDAKRRLAEIEAVPAQSRARSVVLEYEVLQEHYRSMLRNREQAQMAADLERLQIGEQFRVIDGARLPQRKVAPDPLLFMAWGSVSGVAATLVSRGLTAWWRRRRSPAPPS